MASILCLDTLKLKPFFLGSRLFPPKTGKILLFLLIPLRFLFLPHSRRRLQMPTVALSQRLVTITETMPEILQQPTLRLALHLLDASFGDAKLFANLIVRHGLTAKSVLATQYASMPRIEPINGSLQQCRLFLAQNELLRRLVL